MRTLTRLAALVVLFAGLISYIDSRLQKFYIFDPASLHELSKHAIAAHGNDTRAVVAQIVDDLSAALPGGYVNRDEEWIFNNAGGAMGAMWILHASTLPVQTPGDLAWSLAVLTSVSYRCVGVSDNLR